MQRFSQQCFSKVVPFIFIGGKKKKKKKTNMQPHQFLCACCAWISTRKHSMISCENFLIKHFQKNGFAYCNKRLQSWIYYQYRFKTGSWCTVEHLCLAHIKIFDRAIKILSVGRPIYQVWLSQIGRWRAFTLKLCTADHSWELVCFPSVGHRPFIARHCRAMNGRWPTDAKQTSSHEWSAVHNFNVNARHRPIWESQTW